MHHTLHIPVLGLGYSVDTPLKVARYGISSVVSVVDDMLIERMREFHQSANGPFVPISVKSEDYRARRISAYLNLLQKMVDEQVQNLLREEFTSGSDICKYFELLPGESEARILFETYKTAADPAVKSYKEAKLRRLIKPGRIDVNIMSKVDKMNYSKDGVSLGDINSDALAALRGFAQSDLSSALILSAGMNPRLYSYLEEFEDFYPHGQNAPGKQVILKVSDFRSAFIQAKFLAKKGIWVHEFRIESGLNCGGHAFATEGFLLGPILEEFKQKRAEMIPELESLYFPALQAKNISTSWKPETRITVQGGIGTSEENSFLTNYYELDGTGWGSPFLLVPEATNVDAETLAQLTGAGQDDFYISGASPLGIPFNNFRKSSAEKQRLERIAAGRPGSPCTKKFLVSNTEFTTEPICTASREYQLLKIRELEGKNLESNEYQSQFNKITEKVCLCVGLTTSAYLKNSMLKPRENKAVTICPGPNTAYFNRQYSLSEMLGHVYGRVNLLEGIDRSHIFVNELRLYIDYLRTDISSSLLQLNDKKVKQLGKFREQMLAGIDYYNELSSKIAANSQQLGESFRRDLDHFKRIVQEVEIPSQTA